MERETLSHLIQEAMSYRLLRVDVREDEDTGVTVAQANEVGLGRARRQNALGFLARHKAVKAPMVKDDDLERASKTTKQKHRLEKEDFFGATDERRQKFLGCEPSRG